MHIRCPNCATEFEPITDRLTGLSCPSCGHRFAPVSAETISFTPPSQRPTRSSPGLESSDVMDRWGTVDKVLGDFEIERKLGEGGMGLVYLVRSESTGERFAVKRTKHPTPEIRRNFLGELQTWIDLPAHPNLAACRFFRSQGDETIIFAEYVKGGSLASWIRDGELYQGTKEQALERILDAAIQFAWGLHVIHTCGLIHQDVKPGNVLLTQLPDFIVKVSDFGLTRGAPRRANQAAPRRTRRIAWLSRAPD